MNKKSSPRKPSYAEKVTNELIERIKQGTAPWQLPFKPINNDGVPYNHITGNKYNGFNELYLMMQSREDPRWLTYKQAQSVDAQVRKSERGVTLQRVIRYTDRIKKDENGQPVKDEKGQPVTVRAYLDKPIIKTFVVFNAEQIDGLPAYEKEPLPELTWDNDHAAERILTASGADIQHKPGDIAGYYVEKDKIILPEKVQFPDAGSYYATALHELGHWTGHSSRLDRNMEGSFGSESYAKEELRAEIASMMLTRELGLPHNPDRHAAYVESWVNVLQKDSSEILKAAGDAQRIKDYVLSFNHEQSQSIKPDNQPDPSPHQSPAPTATTSIPEPNPFTEERLANAKSQYYSQSVRLNTKEKQTRLLLEYTMEKTITGMNPDMKLQTQINFYENQVKEFNQSRNTEPEQER
ncbi:zincin-like metallopeptidase domain-containing protein [Neisseriaceae bacterium ESL0693]|nr:zincin-like metallopeptidase domain-containing protein [Neisseriaceae bacterium ESL0693]